MKQFKAEWQKGQGFGQDPPTIAHLITQFNVLVEDESSYRQDMNEWINGLEERVRVLEEQGVLSEREEEKKLHQPPVTSWGKEPKKWEHPGKQNTITPPLVEKRTCHCDEIQPGPQPCMCDRPLVVEKKIEEFFKEFGHLFHILDFGDVADWLRTTLSHYQTEKNEAYTKGRSDEAKTCTGCQGRCETQKSALVEMLISDMERQVEDIREKEDYSRKAYMIFLLDRIEHFKSLTRE